MRGFNNCWPRRRNASTVSMPAGRNSKCSYRRFKASRPRLNRKRAYWKLGE